MHVLSFVNQKGGCGKTTTAVHLAGALAARGERVLLVDLDPQAHATLALGRDIDREPSLIDVLRERVTVREAVLAAPGGFDLLAATEALGEFEEIAARMIGPEHVLQRALARSAWSYDFALLDCPPRTDGVLAANALRAAHTAVLVVECGTFALQGALRASVLLDELADTMDEPFEVRAVATLFERRVRLSRELLIGLHAQFGERLYDTPIRTSVRLREAAAASLPVQLFDPRSNAALDFEALAEEIVLATRARDGGDDRAGVSGSKDRSNDHANEPRTPERELALDPLLVSRASAVLHPQPCAAARAWSAHPGGGATARTGRLHTGRRS